MFPKNNLYEEYKKNYIDLTFSKKFPDVTKKITLENINIAINCCEKWDNFLDIGASTGHYSSALVHKFKKGLLVEVTPPAELALLVDKFKNLSVQSVYVEKLQISEKFDFIMLIDLFEHIENIKLFIQQVSSHQEKGGVVYILTPNPLYCGPASESDIYYTKFRDGHRKHYLPLEVTGIMNEYGYQLIRESYEEKPLRDKVRQILNGLARRDTLWSKNILYKIFRFVFHYPLKALVCLMEDIVYRSETRNSDNNIVTRAVSLIYKKK